MTIRADDSLPGDRPGARLVLRHGTAVLGWYWHHRPSAEPEGMLDDAIDLLARAVRTLPSHPSVMLNLGTLLAARFALHGSDPADRDEAIALFEKVALPEGADSDETMAARFQLVQLLLSRAAPGGPFDNLGPAAEAAVSGTLESLLRHVQIGTIDWPGTAERDMERANTHLRILETDDLKREDLRGAIHAMSGAVTVLRGMMNGPAGTGGRTPRSSSNPAFRAIPSTTPGAAAEPYWDEEAAGHFVAAVQSFTESSNPIDREPLISQIEVLGALFRTKVRRPSSTNDLDITIAHMEALLTRLTASHPLVGEVQENLGLTLIRRATINGSTGDFGRALELFHLNLAKMDRDDPRRDRMQPLLTGAMLAAGVIGMDPGMFDAATQASQHLLTEREGAEPEPGSEQAARLAGDRFVKAAVDLLSAASEQGDVTGSEAMALLERAYHDLPVEDDLSPMVAGLIGVALVGRGGRSGGLNDLGVGTDFVEQALATLRWQRDAGLQVTGLDIAHVTALQAFAGLTAVLSQAGVPGSGGESATRTIEEATTALERAIELVPAEYFVLPRLRYLRAVGILWVGLARRDDTGIRKALALLEQAAEGVPEGAPSWLRGHVHTAAMLVAVIRGALDRDIASLDADIERIQALIRSDDPPSREQRQRRKELAQFYRLRHAIGQDPNDLNQSVAGLLLAVSSGAGDPGVSGAADTQWALHKSLRLRGAHGDRTRGEQAGLEALRAGVADVLLQNGVADRLARAKHATALAGEFSRWVLRDRSGRDDAAATAWTALELGRGMVLYAATAAATTADLLDDAGHGELADRWRATPPRPAPRMTTTASPNATEDIARLVLEMPSDLRLRALVALRQAPAGSVLTTLLDGPALDDVLDAMRNSGIAAMVHLLPGNGTEPGYALLLSAGGRWSVLDLPGLVDEPGGTLDDYSTAHRAYLTLADREDTAARSRWREALDRLCGWAWDAAMGAVLGCFAPGVPDVSGDPARLVLVPCGRLGMVPWHAARGSVADRPRFAVQDAVISYAATARQFVETAGRTLPLPGSRPVIVAPHPELAFARALARGLARSTYPGTRLYGPAMSGRPGRGTPDEVLAHMPGGAQPASLLQLGAHARVCPDPLQSYLSLAAGERLTIEQILEQGERDAHRPRGGDGSGADAAGLVVMPACGSDLSDVDHDEALALSTALLAAGWAGVVAARWNTLDLRTSIMIYMFHHFLGESANSKGAVLPADALRLAQLWMLDKNRSVPDGMPLLLAQPARQAHPGGEHEDLELDDPYSWAVLSAQGR